MSEFVKQGLDANEYAVQIIWDEWSALIKKEFGSDHPHYFQSKRGEELYKQAVLNQSKVLLDLGFDSVSGIAMKQMNKI